MFCPRTHATSLRCCVSISKPLQTLRSQDVRCYSTKGTSSNSNKKEYATEQAEPATGALGSYVDDSVDMPYSFLAGVSALGLLLTGYLTWAKLTNSAITCPVGAPGSCATILSSAYANVVGIPLPALGMLSYGAVACLALYGMREQRDSLPARQGVFSVSNLVAYGTSVLAGTSTVLGITLRAQFPDEFCAFCAVSIVASFTLYFTSASFITGRARTISFGSFAATAVAIAALYSTYPAPTSARTFDLPYVAPVVTEESPAGSRDLAIRLREAGAKFYGAFWCSHCFDQKQMFGRDAAADLPYVECYPDGYKGPNSINKVCTDAGVQGFPTWIIRGEVIEGDWPLEYLASVLDGADATIEAVKY